MYGSKLLKLNFPISLNNKEYAKLYALMTSEGSYRTEFNIHVPEIEFHNMFEECISKLISKQASLFIKKKYSKGVLRSRGPAILRHLIPLPPKIPSTIMKSKELSREYLRVAFEAEGSPIINKKQYKRYIKLSRYSDITPLIYDESLQPGKRIYINEIRRRYPQLYNRIKDKPPKLLEGERIILKHHFDIDSKLQLEAIRKNKTDLRCGKITARWVLFIYANNINKFIKDIGFISKSKKDKTEKMKLFRANKPQYSTLYLIKKIMDSKGSFSRKKFIEEMKKIGYKSPECYLKRYCDKSLIIKIEKGIYKYKTSH